MENYTKNLQPSINYTTLNNNSNQYMLYLQNNWNPNGTVSGDVECYGPAVTSSSMSCLNRSYGYDTLSRLTSGGEGFYQNPSSGSGYSRTFSYDEYGNMWVASNGSATPLSGLTPTAQTQISTASNQLAGTNYGYDPEADWDDGQRDEPNDQLHLRCGEPASAKSGCGRSHDGGCA